MKHIFIKGMSSRTFVLLHGTGGNEHDLLEIGKFLDPNANLLGIRGNVVENGMPRFFKRLGMGVFDIENLKEETNNLIDFIEKAIVDYHLNRDELIILGYSNGANIMASMLYNDKFNYSKLIMLHPMRPFKELEMPNRNTRIFIGYGKTDRMISPTEALGLIKLINNAKIPLQVFESPGGHEITINELNAVKAYI